MDVGRAGRGSPGGRPPPKRTYGSSQGSRQTLRKDGQHHAIRGDGSSILPAASSANLGSSAHLTHATPALLQPELANDGLKVSEVASARGLKSAGRFGGAVGGGVRSAEEISQLVREVGEGGEGGRISTIAVAQACKSRETRKAMRANAGEVISELTSAMSVSLRHQRDEAIVHGLAVTMFILSKDRVLVKAFSASAVSTLAVLIQGERGQDAVREDTVGAHTHGVARASSAAAAVAAPAPVRQEKSASKTMGTIDDKYSSSSNRCRDSALQGKRKVSSPFDLSDEDDEEEAPVGVGSIFGVRKASSRATRRAKTDGRILPVNGSTSNEANGHVSTTVMVRARMLLDIADMVPWGMANRHLVSAADLGLATLLNVTSQACPESGGAVGAGGESADEEFSTQGSMASQSEPGSVVGSLVNGQADGSEPTAARNAGVMPELSRLAPSGFLLPLVIVGATVLGDLSAGPSSLKGGDVHAAGASDAAADPSSLRSVHQLLLALRLLDLATLENSGDGDGTAAAEATASKPAQTSPSHHYAELTGALLLVVTNCIPLCGGSTLAAAANFEKGKAPAARRGAGGRNQQSAPVAMGKEVAAKVHECLLAALRVLINVTHHDGRACAEVAAKGGLDTLMSCLVARSYCGSQGGDSSGSSSGGLAATHPKSDLAILEDVVNGVGEDMPGLEQGSADSPGDFDAQVLSMSALINCVELKESADNCTAMARLAVHPPGARVPGERRKQQQQQQLPTAGGLSSSRCLAPEFLAKLLVCCTRSFAHQLGGDRPGEDGEEELVSAAPAEAQQPGRGITDRNSSDGDGSSTALAVTATGERTASTTSAIQQEGDSGEQLMSHSEGTDLVLGGHCALLLGLLVRDQDSNRRLALPLLPDGDPNLIVRVLEAFMALQFQAGVLTEEMVLAVQGLVEELEGLEALPVEEWNPFELDATDEAATSVTSKPTAGATGAASSDIAATSSTQRGRKRPRSPPSSNSITLSVERVCANPRSGQRTGEAGEAALEGDDSSADGDISSTAKRSRTAARVEPTPSLWMSQSLCTQTGPRPKPSKPSAMSSSASSSMQDFSCSEKRTSTATPSKHPGSGDSGETPPSRNHTARGSATASSSSWRVAGTSMAGRIGMGIRGGSAAGARSWLGSSPQLRTYGSSRRTYGSQKWKNKPSPTVAGQHASPAYRDVGKEAATGPGGKPSSIVLEVFPKNSEGETTTTLPRSNSGVRSGGGGGGKGSGVRAGGVGPRSGRGGTGVTTAASSSFDVDDWSDSSNEPPATKAKISSRAPPKCQLHSPASSSSSSSKEGCAGFSGGGGGGRDDRVAAQPKNEKCRRRSPSPSPPRAAARAAGSSSSPRARVGSGGGGVANETAVVPTADVRTVVGQRPGPASGEVTSRPPTGRPGVSRWQEGSGVGAGAGELRAPVGGGGGARGRFGGFKEAPTRRVFGAGAGSTEEGKGGVAKSAHRSVFEMSDEDESD